MDTSNDELDKKLQSLENLYENNPLQFEFLRNEIIQQCINSYPERFQHRARGIQFTLDCELNKYKNPLARMNRMVELFWSKVSDFNEAMDDPKKFSAKQKRNENIGKILPFC
jgi:uncharacterized protein YaaN involved in tellurite resistance